MTAAEDSLERARSVRRAATIGALVGAVPFFWMVTAGTCNPFRRQEMGDFFDAQAHALLRGELFVDRKLLNVEAFPGTGGHWYLYFGPWPAILRLPFALFTDKLDGRLAAASMLLAYAVSMTALIRVASDVACRIEGQPLTRLERLLVGAMFAVLGGGSTLVYLASVPWVFHEATSWGIAWALATFAATRRVMTDDTRRAVVVVALASTLTAVSRISIALGAVAAVALAALFAPARTLARRGALFVSGALGPVAVYMAINYAKFGTLTSIPSMGQVGTLADPERQLMLAGNRGSLFGLKYVPTTFFAYLRPDGIRFQRCFPFVDFPLVPGKIFGDVPLDKFDVVASITTTLPLLWLLSAIGIFATFRRAALSPYKVVLAGAAASWATVIPFAHIAHRYTGDAFPLLSLGSVVGIVSLLGARVSRARFAAFVALAGATTWSNLGLALLYQRIYVQVRDHEKLVSFLKGQLFIDQVLHNGSPWRVEKGEMSVRGRRNEFFVVGDCDALYYSDGHKPSTLEHHSWFPVERTERAGFFEVLVVVPTLQTNVTQPILSVMDWPYPDAVIGLERIGDRHARLVYRGRGVPAEGDVFEAAPGSMLDLTIDADRRLGLLRVVAQGRELLITWYDAGSDNYRLGVPNPFGVAQELSGTVIRKHASGAPLCRKLLALERQN